MRGVPARRGQRRPGSAPAVRLLHGRGRDARLRRRRKPGAPCSSSRTAARSARSAAAASRRRVEAAGHRQAAPRRRRPGGSADVSPRRHPRMGRRPDLRRPDDRSRRARSPAGSDAAAAYLLYCMISHGEGPGLHRGGRNVLSDRRGRCRQAATAISSTPTVPSTRPKVGQLAPRSAPATRGASRPSWSPPGWTHGRPVRSPRRRARRRLPPARRRRVTVFLVGGGHVGEAVAGLAAEVSDFEVWVLDDREQLRQRRSASHPPDRPHGRRHRPRRWPSWLCRR